MSESEAQTNAVSIEPSASTRPLPTITAAFAAGVRRALGVPRVILLVWFLTLFLAVLVALPAWPYLSTMLTDRPAAWQLARGQADILWVELISIDGPYLNMLTLTVGFAVVISTLARLLLSGGILPALLPEGHPLRPRRGELLQRAGAAFGAMLRIELVGFICLRLPIFAALVAIGLAISRSPMVMEQSFASLLAKSLVPLTIGIWLWISTGLVISYACLYRLAQPLAEASTMRAFSDGLKLGIGRASGRTLGLGLIGLLLTLAVVAGGRWVAAQLDYGLLVATGFLFRQLAALLRTLVALSVTASAAEIWRHSSE